MYIFKYHIIVTLVRFFKILQNPQSYLKELKLPSYLVWKQQKTLHFNDSKLIMNYLFINRDATVLSKLMTAIVFNSVPMEDIQDVGQDNSRARTKSLIFEMMRYGVRDLFNPDELVQGKNIRHVTHCIDELRQLAEKDPGSILAAPPPPSS